MRDRFRIIILILPFVFMIGGVCYGVPAVTGSFGANGESGTYFDPDFNCTTCVGQTCDPGINFAGAGGVNAALTQVQEFDAAIHVRGIEGSYYLTDDSFYSMIPLDVTPEYTDISGVQSGKPYVVQHYSIVNNSSSPVNDIWFMSYINADLMRCGADSHRVGAVNDESVAVSKLNGSSVNNLSIRQYQTDNTEVYFEGVLYRQGLFGGADKYAVGTEGDIYNDIYDTGADTFLNASMIYLSGIDTYGSAEQTVSMGWYIGTLGVGESVELAVSVATMSGAWSETYLRNLYNMPLPMVPEPSTFILLVIPSILSLIRKFKK